MYQIIAKSLIPNSEALGFGGPLYSALRVARNFDPVFIVEMSLVDKETRQDNIVTYFFNDIESAAKAIRNNEFNDHGMYALLMPQSAGNADMLLVKLSRAARINGKTDGGIPFSGLAFDSVEGRRFVLSPDVELFQIPERLRAGTQDLYLRNDYPVRKIRDVVPGELPATSSQTLGH